MKNHDVCVIGESSLDILVKIDSVEQRTGGLSYSLRVLCKNNLNVKCISFASKVWLKTLEKTLAKSASNLDFIKAGIKSNSEAVYTIKHYDEVINQHVVETSSAWADETVVIAEIGKTTAKDFLIFPQKNISLTKVVAEIKNKHKKSKIYLDLQHDISHLSTKDLENILSKVDFVFVSLNEVSTFLKAKNILKPIEFLRKNSKHTLIVKNGLGGLAIIHKKNVNKIPAFHSDYDCTIGAGDILIAAFIVAQFKNYNSEQSLLIAQNKCARFIEKISHKNLDFLKVDTYANEIKSFSTVGMSYVPLKESEKISVYLAASFKTSANVMYIDFIEHLLTSKGIKVFSPYKEFGILKKSSTALDRKNTFNNDLKLLDKTNILVVLSDIGSMGTFWEVGYFYKLQNEQKSNIINFQTNTSIEISNMLKCSSIVVRDYRSFIHEIFLAAARHSK